MVMRSLLIGFLVSFSAIASAQPQSPQAFGFAAVQAGYGDPTNINGRLAWGVDLGMMLPNGITGVLYFKENAAKESGVNVRIDHYGLGMDWSLAGIFSGPLAGIKGGARVGVSTVDVNLPPGSKSDTEFSFGPAIGYDWALPYGLSVGAEGDLFFTTGPRQFSTLYVTGNLKYWF